MFCRNCGADIAENQVQCPKCGTIIEEVQQVKQVVHCVSAKKRNTALLLAVIGLFIPLPPIGGLHRLYSGHYLIGMLYAFTLNGFIIGGLYDLWCLYNESYTDAEGFPIVAETEFYSNYKRRPLNNEKSVLCIAGIYILVYGFLHVILSIVRLSPYNGVN